MQQTTYADSIFRITFAGALRVNHFLFITLVEAVLHWGI